MLEVGLGGRLDAVNIVDAEAAIVCSIGLDHADWLGTDIEVDRPGEGRCVPRGKPRRAGGSGHDAHGCRGSAAHWRPRTACRRATIATDCSQGVDRNPSGDFEMPGLKLAGLPLPALPGARQYANAAAAIATLQAMGLPRPLQASDRGAALRTLGAPGRFQVVPGPVEWILDVAHNEPAARVLAENLAPAPCTGRTLIVAGILGDKDVDGVARALASSRPCVDCLWHRRTAWTDCSATGVAVRSLQGRAPGHRHPRRHAHGRAAGASRVIASSSAVHSSTVAPALQALGLY